MAEGIFDLNIIAATISSFFFEILLSIIFQLIANVISIIIEIAIAT